MFTALVLPPLVGRERELKSLVQLLEVAFNRKGAVILVAGEAGVGKSRLCEQFGKLATEKGCEFIVGRCVPGAPTPYLPFQDAFSRMVLPREKEFGLRQWIRGAGSSTFDSQHRGAARPPEMRFGLKQWIAGPDLNPESESERTLHATLEFLRRMSDKHPIVLVLEDLHWADSSSIQLLHFMARNSDGLRLLLVGTYRPEDLMEAGERVHPFLDSLRVMRREEVCQEIKLSRLNLEELRLAVEGMLSGPITQELLEEVASESGGNPLFIVEAVRLLHQTGSIALKEGAWRATGTVPVDVPSTIKEVIMRRVERLPAEQRRVLECASVVGPSFDPAIVEGVLSLTRLTVLETLDSIGRSTELVNASDSLYSFSHEKVQRTIYDEISSPRRKELHRKTAQALEANTPNEALYGQLSSHFFAAGETSKCIQYSLSAGQSSLKKLSTAEAIAYFERVSHLTKDEPTLAPVRSQALEGIGDAHKAMGVDDSAAKYYEHFLKLSAVTRDKARVMRKCAECLLLTNNSRALELLEEAEKCEEIEKVEYGRVIKLRGSYAVISGALDQAQGSFSTAQGIFEDTSSTEDLAKLCHSLSDLYLSRGKTGEALASAEKAVELFAKLQSPIGEATASFQLGSVYWNMGLHEQAMASYARAITTLAKFGRYRALAEAYEYRAGVQYDIGDFESARTEALKAREYGLRANSAYWQAHACFILAIAEFRLNRIGEGERWYQNGSELLKSLGKLADTRSPIPILAMLAEAHLLDARGDWNASVERFLKSIELYQGTYWGVLHEALARTQFGEAALAQGFAAEAREQFIKAAEIYERLGNKTQVEKLNRLLAKAN